MTKAKVLIIGFGGVGIVSGYSLEHNGKAEVTAVVRSDYELVIEKGYDIESVDYGRVEGFRPSHLVKTVEKAAEYGPFDFVLVTTKNTPDIFKIEDLIRPVVTPKLTTVVLSQNGIGIQDSVINLFPENIVLSVVSMISSNKFKTIVKHVSKDISGVGYFENENLHKCIQKEAAEWFISLYSNQFNECYYDSDTNYARWRKLVYNATLNSVCTLTGVDSGRLEMFGGYEGIIKIAMNEVVSIARADGANLPDDIIEIMLRADDGIWCTPSMLVDSRKGNFIELEVIAGNPVRIAKTHGISAPFLTMAYELLKVIQCHTKEAKGLITIPEERPLNHKAS